MNTSMRRVIVAMSIMVSLQGTVLLSFDDLFKRVAFYTGITATVGGVSYWAYKNICVYRKVDQVVSSFNDQRNGASISGSAFKKLYLLGVDEKGMPKQTAPVQSVTVNIADNNGQANNTTLAYDSWLSREINNYGGTKDDITNSKEYLEALQKRLSECSVISFLEKDPVVALQKAKTYNNEFNALDKSSSKWDLNPVGSYTALQSSIPWYSQMVNLSSARILHLHYQVDRAIAWNGRIESRLQKQD